MSETSLSPPPASAPRSRAGAALRTIAALILREMTTRYGKTPGGYAWALIQPLGMIILLAYAWSLLARTPSLGTSFLLFKGTGLLALGMFTTLGGMVGGAIKFSKPLLSYPGVTWIDAILARFLLNTLILALVTYIILYGIILWDDVQTILAWDRILLAMGFAAGTGFGVGCLNGYLFQRFPVWEQVWGILTRPLFLISGVVILYEDMPSVAQTFLWYNPLLHITGIMREGFYPVYQPGYISLAYVSICMLGPMLLGLLLLRRHARQLLQL